MLCILGEGFHPFLWLFFFFLNYILAITMALLQVIGVWEKRPNESGQKSKKKNRNKEIPHTINTCKRVSK